MTTFDTLQALDDMTRDAVIDLLYRLADDALIIGQRDSGPSSLAQIPGEDAAFHPAARDEIGRANTYYVMLHELNEPSPQDVVVNRQVRQWHCAAFMSLPDNHDWAFYVLRKFLYDVADMVRLTSLSDSTLVPLARLARTLRDEKKEHLVHHRARVLRLGRAGGESRRRMQAALDYAYPYALGLFEPTEADEVLAQAGVSPREGQLRREWDSAVAPVLHQAGLLVNENARPIHGGRVGVHPQELAPLLEDLGRSHGVLAPSV